MKKKTGIFDAIIIYFPVLILLFQGLKLAYDKYNEIKQQNETAAQNDVN